MSMPKYNPNEDTFAELPDEGNRMVQVIDCEEKVSKAGNPMMEFQIQVCPNQQGEGYILWWYLVSGTDFYHRSLGGLLRGFGIPDYMGIEPTVRLFKGKRAVARLKHEEYEGKTNAKIHYWLPFGDAGLDNEFSAPSVKSRESNRESNDDGVPF